jgi:hypothetical protein
MTRQHCLVGGVLFLLGWGVVLTSAQLVLASRYGDGRPAPEVADRLFSGGSEGGLRLSLEQARELSYRRGAAGAELLAADQLISHAKGDLFAHACSTAALPTVMALGGPLRVSHKCQRGF